MVHHNSIEVSVQPLVLDAHAIIDDSADLLSLLQHAVGSSVSFETPLSTAAGGVEQVKDHVLLITQIYIVGLLGCCLQLLALCIILLSDGRLLRRSALETIQR